MQLLFFFVNTLVIIGLDLWTKYFFSHILQGGDIVLHKYLTFTLQYNYGIAFSLPVTGVFQIILTLLLLAALMIYFSTQWKWEYWGVSFSAACISGGAIGNLYERIMGNGVTDFIQVFPWFPVFNLADSFVFLGVCILIFFEYTHKRS